MNVVKTSSVKIPNLKILEKWIQKTEQLSSDSLIQFSLEVNPDEKFKLETVIEWSEDVNRMVQITAINLPPMEGALEAMGLLKGNVDLVVISNTPLKTLHREWLENNIFNNILYIGGQETGTKTQMLKAVAENKYDPNKILIIGDAPGDLKAAQNINALFFPILPLKEEMSWREFNAFGYDHFINDSYKGEYQNNQIQKFQSILNLAPPW